MKFSQNAQAALRQSDSRAVAVEMTPELKEKYSRVCGEVFDLLKSRSEGPKEAYMMLQFVLHAMEDHYGIRGGVIVEHSDGEQ